MKSDSIQDKAFWDKKKEAMEKCEEIKREQEKVDRQKTLTFWLNEQAKMNKSNLRGGSLSGCYTSEGIISLALVIIYEDFLSAPSFVKWRNICTSKILPSMTMNDAWHEVNLSVPALDVIMKDELYPDAEQLKKGVTLLVQQRAIEVESSIVANRADRRINHFFS